MQQWDAKPAPRTFPSLRPATTPRWSGTPGPSPTRRSLLCEISFIIHGFWGNARESFCKGQRAKPFRPCFARPPPHLWGGFLAGKARAIRRPTQWGDSPLRGEMSRSDRGVRVRRTGRAKRGLRGFDGPCVISRQRGRRPPAFLVKKLTAQILRFLTCKSAPYVVQYKLTKYGKNRRNSKWNTAIRS